MKKFLTILIFIFCPNAFCQETNDSAEHKNFLYNLLKKQELYVKEQKFDNETLFSPYIVKRQNFIGSDYFTWEDALMSNPNFTAVRYSPSFAMNRTTFRGYLIPIEDNFLNRLYLPALPFYYQDLLEISEFEILPDGSINKNLFNKLTATPDVFFVWEGGLFEGNLLKFRMLRNLSKKLSLLAFTSYSDLKRKDYFHGGGMADLFTTYETDSTKISIYGYNPYSLINKSGIELNWHGNFSANLRYSYSDIRQDLAYHSDSALQNKTSLSIAYNESNNFLNQLDALVEIPLGDKFLWRNIAKLETVYQYENPISRTRNGNFATYRTQQNNTLQSGGTQFYFAPAISDTVSIQVSANRYISDTCDITYKVAHHIKIVAENKFISQNFDNFSAKIDGGGQFVRANHSKIERYPFASLQADLKINNFRTQFWGKHDIVPMVFSYNNIFSQLQDLLKIANTYFGFGANLHYQFPVASIYGGYSNLITFRNEISSLQNNDNLIVNKFWHNNAAPYENPEQVFSAGGSFGEIKGISLFSNWLFSDQMPYLKSYSGLRFHFNKDLQVRHFYVDISYNYWSKKDWRSNFYFSEPLTMSPFGNYTHWDRPIHDVSVKLSAEIETFRLFWKIDNFLNRTNSYVPGYIMPGLIFRWGFSWNILG
ncbi:MAG: hypothetical protein LBH98_05570 [Chitinispirillales bacterium]|jgi:hypothetical protein|nr:hypothetical protein [Chitinispirillales bacterium]